MQVLNELYVTLTRKLRPGLSADAAWDDVEALMAWEPAAVDREVMMRAHEISRRYRLSWWDSLVVASAQSQHCDMLLTEDLQHGMRFGSVVVRSPFHLEVGEAPAMYQADERTLARHKRRGRPRSAAMR